MIMLGDRNIGTIGTQNVPAISTNSSIAVNHGQQWTGSALQWWAWTANDIHLRVGNLGMADGSAQQATIGGLQTALTTATNGASNPSPWYNFPQ
jgi:hypothetical protein